MGSNAVLDIAIGLVLMYLVLSLIGTVVNEFIATLNKTRASTLKTAIPRILDNPTLLADFYNHGLIDSTNKAAAGGHASYFSGQTFAMAVLGSLDATKPIPGFADVKSAIENMPDCNIRDVLLAQLATANGSLDTLSTGIANYFDDVMDRVSGIYKQYLKWISLGVGLFIVALLNADSIAVGTALWKDSSLRAEMVESAKSALASSPSEACKDTDIVKKLNCLENEIRPLPLGWYAWPDSSWHWFWKIIGLFLSALAVSLGAPFWFDLLSKFVNIRGSGPPPERTPS
jgi:hypothetical protein